MFLVKITLKLFGLEHTHWFLVKSTQYSYFVLVHAHTQIFWFLMKNTQSFSFGLNFGFDFWINTKL